jgi:hypothetical protein
MNLLFAAAVLSSVLQYPLPDALVSSNGQPVRSAQTWRSQRRPEIMRLFTDQVYGETPSAKPEIHFRVTSTDEHALNGAAVRKQVTVFFSKDETGPRMHLLVYSPAKPRGRVPVFLGLNFFGNETVNADPGIDLPEVWIKGQKTKAEEKARGSNAQQWQVEKIISRGFALATAYCGDIEPDFAGGMEFGVRHLFLQAGQTKPADGQWGTLGAWAWGLSRAVDYLETDRAIDPKKVILIGHSRLGKATLWSAAQDTRFRVVISNESGVGGASLYRAATGETIEHLNTAFPHWFCINFHQYTGHPDRVPVDGNLLLSLIAPRPLYVASAELDKSSDPPAEFLSAVEASKVYELLGKRGLGTDKMPPLNQPIMTGTVAYHVRDGKHDVTAFDWDQYLAFAELQLRKR